MKPKLESRWAGSYFRLGRLSSLFYPLNLGVRRFPNEISLVFVKHCLSLQRPVLQRWHKGSEPCLLQGLVAVFCPRSRRRLQFDLSPQNCRIRSRQCDSCSHLRTVSTIDGTFEGHARWPSAWTRLVAQKCWRYFGWWPIVCSMFGIKRVLGSCIVERSYLRS